MSDVLLHIDGETLDQAIIELTARITDLADGSANATRTFEKIIGSDTIPDLTTEERISRLDAIRKELEKVLVFVDGEEEDDDDDDVAGASGAADDEMDPLSEHAILVLTDIAADRGPAMLFGPHILVGKGMPSATLYRSAAIARGHLSTLLLALNDETFPEPAITFLPFFEAYEDVVDDEGEDPDFDDMVVCDTAIGYLTMICDNLDVAWKEGIAVPECLFDHVLLPFLEQISESKMH